MWKERSHLLIMKPKSIRGRLSLSNHCLGAYLRSYKALCKRQTREEFLVNNLGGCSIYTSSSRMSFKKAVLMSSCWMLHLWVRTIVRMSLMVTGLITGRECFMKIKTMLLVKAFGIQSSFIFINLHFPWHETPTYNQLPFCLEAVGQGTRFYFSQGQSTLPSW